MMLNDSKTEGNYWEMDSKNPIDPEDLLESRVDSIKKIYWLYLHIEFVEKVK